MEPTGAIAAGAPPGRTTPLSTSGTRRLSSASRPRLSPARVSCRIGSPRVPALREVLRLQSDLRGQAAHKGALIPPGEQVAALKTMLAKSLRSQLPPPGLQ